MYNFVCHCVCFNVKSLTFPDSVRMMALTPTATNKTTAYIIKTLNMQKPTVVSIPPIKDNVMYADAVEAHGTVWYELHGRNVLPLSFYRYMKAH